MLAFILPVALLPLLVQADGFERILEKRADLSVQVKGNPVQCGEAEIIITGGKAPYQVTLVPPGGGTSLMVLPPSSDEGAYSWTVNLSGDQGVVVQVADVAGGSAESPSLNVGTSQNRDCLPGGASAVQDAGSVLVFESSVAPPADAGGEATTTPAEDDGASGGGQTSKEGGDGGATPTATPTDADATGDATGATDAAPTDTAAAAGPSTAWVTETESADGAEPTDSEGGAGSMLRASSFLVAAAGALAMLL